MEEIKLEKAIDLITEACPYIFESLEQKHVEALTRHIDNYLETLKEKFTNQKPETSATESFRWVNALERLPPVGKTTLVQYGKGDRELGNYWYVKELIENGWLDVEWLEEIEPPLREERGRGEAGARQQNIY